jgi:serine/threonine-protein kinase
MLTGQAPFHGENINAIMYQTLNTTPSSPSSLNSAVPEMLNFILAKALAKDLESRYQNARDLANDLRSCRDTLPFTATANVPVGTHTESGVGAGSSIRTPGDDSKPAVALGLSTSFDSAEATMRLAALTASHEDVEELSMTLRMARPSIEDINRTAAGLQAHTGDRTTQSLTATGSMSVPHSNFGGCLLLAIIIIVVIGLISTIAF